MFIILFGAKGEIGKIFCKKFKEAGCKVLGVEKEDGAEKWLAKIKEAQMVCLCVPIASSPALAEKITPHLTENQIFSDFTSVKNAVLEKMQKSKASIISVHPMFGKLKKITGQKILLLPVRCKKNQITKLKKLYKSFQLEVYVLEKWQEHDNYMSLIQALLHFSQICLLETIKENKLDIKTILAVCSPIYKINFSIITRILPRNPELYAHILMDNEHSVAMLEMFLEKIKKQLDLVKKKKTKEYIKNFHNNRKFLAKTPKEAKALQDLSAFLIQEMQKNS